MARRTPHPDRPANVALAAFFALVVVYVAALSALSEGGSAAMRTWPVPGDAANTDGWRLTGDAVTVRSDEGGWLIATSTGGRVTAHGAPVRATGGGVRLDATAGRHGAARGALPVVECFGEEVGGGYRVRFGDGVVHIAGGSVDATEEFAGSDGVKVAATVTCTLGADGATVTVAGPTADVAAVEITDAAPPRPGPVGLHLEGPSAVTFTALELTATRS